MLVAKCDFLKKHCFSRLFRLERRTYREIAWVVWRGRVFLEKKLSGWPGNVFLEKQTGLDGLGAYFSRKFNEKYALILVLHRILTIHRFVINVLLFCSNIRISHLCATLDLMLH